MLSYGELLKMRQQKFALSRNTNIRPFFWSSDAVTKGALAAGTSSKMQIFLNFFKGSKRSRLALSDMIVTILLLTVTVMLNAVFKTIKEVLEKISHFQFLKIENKNFFYL